jgi:hypothetical protein
MLQAGVQHPCFEWSNLGENALPCSIGIMVRQGIHGAKEETLFGQSAGDDADNE